MSSSYHRRPTWKSRYSDYGPTITKITIHWSNKSSAYAIKFSDTKNWDKMQILISFLKNIPYGERDYDPDEKTWYLIEKYIEPFKQIVIQFTGIFEMEFVAKPENQTNTHNFVPIAVWEEKYKKLTGLPNTEKKPYLRWLMANHPDKKPENYELVRDVNECWNEIHKKVVEQIV